MLIYFTLGLTLVLSMLYLVTYRDIFVKDIKVSIEKLNDLQSSQTSY